MALLKGLEVKEILFSETKLDNEKFRLDDGFFLKKYLAAYEKIKLRDHILFSDAIDVLTDYHANGSYQMLNSNVTILDESDYAYMVRSTDLEKQDFASDVKYVDKDAYKYLKKTSLFGGEILINKIGNPGRVYVMPTLSKPATVGMNLFMVRLKDDAHLNSNYIWAFFNSTTGQRIIFRKASGTVPLTIDKEAVRSLYIPLASSQFQQKIEKLILNSQKNLANSKTLYSQAESLLLEEIGLQGFEPSKEPINVKRFSESFAESGRLDAEYYQPKFEQVIEEIATHPHNRLSSLVTISKSVEPGSKHYADEGLPFLRVADYSKFGITNPQKFLSDHYVEEHKNLIETLKPKKDTVLFSKDGSVGTAYHLREDKNLVTSGAVLHLHLKDKSQILPQYLALALNSELVQMQAERDAGGSVILHWRISEIKDVIVPIIDYDKQEKIAELVEESFSLKQHGEALLELAKSAVELAIEKSEDEALNLIDSSA